MPDDRLIMIANGCIVPEDNDKKEQLMEDIYSALASVLIEYQTFPERINVYDGDVYSQVEDRCPECNKQLRLRRVEPDSSNGATAPAVCDCGWRSDVVYRIIDIVENLDDPDSFFEPDSVVENYGVEPQYVPHTDTTLHTFKPGED
jgi:hypothetical protein